MVTLEEVLNGSDRQISLRKVDPETGKLAATDSKISFEGGPICIEFLD